MDSNRYKNRRYEVIHYDPAWLDEFSKEERTLQGIFGNDAVSIEHIGSTAVPGLAAKPTIDILITVKDISVADRHAPKIEEAGYHAFGNYVDEKARLFAREVNNMRECNVHIFETKHPHVLEMLRMRDYLRTHPDVVAEYSALKLELARKYPTDYAQYRKCKDEWMDRLKENLPA